MSKSLNQCNFIGNLIKDPELKYTQDGKAISNFCIAVNGYADKVEFVNCLAFDKLAEICGEYLKKGKKVFVSARYENQKYQAKDGTEKKSNRFIVSEMQMLSKADNDTSRPENIMPGDDVHW